MNGKKIKFILLAIIFLIPIFYGLGRLYYSLTGGFTLSNITYDLPHDERFSIPSLTEEESKKINSILSEKFYYLGKGCQSYVFESEDKKYVLKFFKYQRFRPSNWLKLFSFVPQVENYRLAKVNKKRQKLEQVFASWKIAYTDLQPETGVIFIHLNKSKQLNQKIVIYDKIGLKHELDSDQYEFLIQYKAQLLSPTLTTAMRKGESLLAKELIDRLVLLLLSEYQRGFADNDHALMQNTGVLNGFPIHIDVGQFVKNKRVKQQEVYAQELFNKTWKFRQWLQAEHPLLATHLVERLREVIEEPLFSSLKPRLNKATMGIILPEE